ncbi:succinate dehydrogenase cytochrome b subunit [Flavobacterium wongokense]|uniref:succinate dehydrogenase cytochrome b subunit n=1 Tax=Flavobacterium wongokense TaxID=2910674 RepID=UPI001F2555E6|nr:succinate dehydrogenase cytochrome b subunit [Flavobacterium sp. WG47]MCF6131315.1 succinate dehydrogenase cytochrome b subunit [Flavobacterium sp. WG47]
MAKSSILSSSIAKKVAMALSGLFLVSFLLLHVSINLTSIFSADVFNECSHFMGYNPLVQYVLQPILAIGVVFHFVMGFVLELQNRAARPIAYAKNNGSANSSWASRNMIISGLVVLAFLGLHFYDFWFPEINYKFIQGMPIDETRYFPELVHKFHSPVRTGLYCLSFVLLALHLWHGFNSSMQSVGFNNKFSRGLHKLGYAFAIVVPFGFIVIALFHHFNQ